MEANQAKHFLASRTLWVHVLTLVLAFAATAQGDAWISEHPGWMQFLVYFSAFMGVVLRMLTDKPITAKTGGDSNRGGNGAPPRILLLLAVACACCASPAVGQEPRDALAEVNAVRRSRGLRPFLRDGGLLRAAKSCAKYRADRLISGHTANDFSALPRGSWADAAGCAAWYGNGWGSCCTYENYRFAGAAWCRGRDGRRYMHLFVRH